MVRIGAQDTDARVPQRPTLWSHHDKRRDIPHHSNTAEHCRTQRCYTARREAHSGHSGSEAARGPPPPQTRQEGPRMPPPHQSDTGEREDRQGVGTVTVHPPRQDTSYSATPRVNSATTPIDPSVDRHRPHTTHNAGPRGHEWPDHRSLLSSHRPKGHDWRIRVHRPVPRTSPRQAPAPKEAGWRARQSGPRETRHVSNPELTAEPHRTRQRRTNGTPTRRSDHHCRTRRTPRKPRHRRRARTVQTTRTGPRPSHRDRPMQRQPPRPPGTSSPPPRTPRPSKPSHLHPADRNVTTPAKPPNLPAPQPKTRRPCHHHPQDRRNRGTTAPSPRRSGKESMISSKTPRQTAW